MDEKVNCIKKQNLYNEAIVNGGCDIWVNKNEIVERWWTPTGNTGENSNYRESWGKEEIISAWIGLVIVLGVFILGVIIGMRI